MIGKLYAFAARLFILGMKIWRQARGQTNQIEFAQRVGEYRQMWEQAAQDIGATFSVIGEDLWEVRRGAQFTRIANHMLQFDDPVVLRLAGHKTLVYDMLEDAGVPVPDYQTFGLKELDKARRFLKTHPDGCVVKPARGFGGKGVTTNITRNSELRNAAFLASLYDAKLIIEPHVYGECCRVLVLNGRAIHAVRRPGIRVLGNGKDTLSALFAAQFKLSPAEARKRLKDDRDVRFCLRKSKLDLDSILPKDETALIKSRREFVDVLYEQRTAYGEDVTESIDPSLLETSENVAKILDTQLIGVDIITPDISKPLRESGGIVNEANTTPAVHHHFRQNTPLGHAVAAQVLEAALNRDRVSNFENERTYRRA